MIFVKVGKATEGYICYGHMVHWPKDDKKELEFAKPCKKTAEMEQLIKEASELEAAGSLLEAGAKFQEWKNLKKVAMKDWSEDKLKDEGFKKNIKSVLEKILGDKHQQDDISIELTKDSWDKLKKGTLASADLEMFSLKSCGC